MLRKMYDWVFTLARSPHAEKALAAVSVAEASIFPIPIEVMLAPMILSRPERAYRFAAIASIGSVIGGVLGYLIGFYLTDLGQWLMRLLGHADGLAEFQHWYDRFGVWVILIKGLTPIPYKLVTIASGLAHFNFGIFFLASVVTRSARFFMEAWVLKTWGPAMLEVVERRLALWSVVGLVVFIGGFAALKLL
ncbi:DedA family protein [Brevundimonas sp. AJA228-03]|uniref:YqaA family protein n=1 Tax=Brevundimonas sp. AJA228-03 TaxID=2752515 RepID=UPI001ADF0983|nr:YqaA family protein [Brevundimonas sp. AJA228-03]QTN19639.1 DedA family protein [Brevundimonas sp. AJA228-03]